MIIHERGSPSLWHPTFVATSGVSAQGPGPRACYPLFRILYARRCFGSGQEPENHQSSHGQWLIGPWLTGSGWFVKR